MKYFCSYQEKLVSELRQGRPHEMWDETLRSHIARCRSCNDLLLVSEALQQDRSEMVKSAQVASPGTLWWQAQVRMRNGAMQRVTRPIALVEKFALASLISVLLAGFAWKRSELLGWLMGVAAPSAHPAALAAPSLIDGWATLLMAAGLGTVAIFAGLAVYLLREKE